MNRIEDHLRASRPEPDPEFAAGLEERLLERRESRFRLPSPRHRGPLFAGAAAATAMASAALVLSLAGVGPLAAGEGSVSADEQCHWVTVKRTERVPEIVQRNGRTELRFSQRSVERRVKRCS